MLNTEHNTNFTPSQNSVEANNQNQQNHCCTSPEDAFVTATALAILFAKELNYEQLQTLVNILTLLIVSLSTFIRQKDICEGINVTPLL